MANGRQTLALLLLLLLPAVLWGVPGRGMKEPLSFRDLSAWLSDGRPSLELFEETLSKDMLAGRLRATIVPFPVYVLRDIGTVYRADITHVSFQGMVWGPVFGLAGTLPLIFVEDDPALKAASAALFLTTGLLLSISSLFPEGLGSLENVLRINVLYSSDVFTLDMKKTAGNYYYNYESSLIGRTYAGLCFKILDDSWFFAGYNFIHLPRLDGWQEFLGTDSAYTEGGSVSIRDRSNGVTLFENHSRLVFHSSILKLVQLRGLVNTENPDKAIDLAGIGLSLQPAKELALGGFLNYIGASNKVSLDLRGKWDVTRGVSADLKWNCAISPFQPADFLKLGLSLEWAWLELWDKKSFQKCALSARLEACTFADGSDRRYGFRGEGALVLPLNTRISAGASYNLDETMNQFPFARDEWVYTVQAEFGMDDNLSYTDMQRVFSSLFRTLFMGGRSL